VPTCLRFTASVGVETATRSGAERPIVLCGTSFGPSARLGVASANGSVALGDLVHDRSLVVAHLPASLSPRTWCPLPYGEDSTTKAWRLQ